MIQLGIGKSLEGKDELFCAVDSVPYMMYDRSFLIQMMGTFFLLEYHNMIV